VLVTSVPGAGSNYCNNVSNVLAFAYTFPWQQARQTPHGTIPHLGTASRVKKDVTIGMIMDSKLTWKQHVVKKRKQIDLTTKQMNWLIGRKSKLAVDNKILIYMAIIIPIWTYGLELWGYASKSNTSIIQRSQSKILRMIVDAPW
jgi:hypothetical protein